jgi:hypothetical protein
MAKERPTADVVLVLAPTGADAENIRAVLSKAGFDPRLCRTEADLQHGLAGECAIVLLTEEALTPGVRGVIDVALATQPPWSDIPIVLISSVGITKLGQKAAARLGGAASHGNTH